MLKQIFIHSQKFFQCESVNKHEENNENYSLRTKFNEINIKSFIWREFS